MSKNKPYLKHSGLANFWIERKKMNTECLWFPCTQFYFTQQKRSTCYVAVVEVIRLCTCCRRTAVLSAVRYNPIAASSLRNRSSRLRFLSASWVSTRKKKERGWAHEKTKGSQNKLPTAHKQQIGLRSLLIRLLTFFCSYFSIANITLFHGSYFNFIINPFFHMHAYESLKCTIIVAQTCTG